VRRRRSGFKCFAPDAGSGSGGKKKAEGKEEDGQLSFFAGSTESAPATKTPAQRGQETKSPAAVTEAVEKTLPLPTAPESGAAEPTEQTPRPAAPARTAKLAAAQPATKPDEAPILAVAELVRKARLLLEARFGDVRVEGEISGFKRSANGHFYFTLKDSEAQIDCVMYAREASRLKFRMADGQLVRCRGKLTIYEGRGRFQLQVNTAEPAGAGALAVAFEALKQKLMAEGLFDNERKRPLPFLPRRIGVVTSRQGAVIRDIVRVAHRRFPVPILVAPTPVQGEGAAATITAAIQSLCCAPEVDVIIIARGGGSIEDLWAFNDEALARAIAACPIPTISAVGHETDFTIADFVADVRAPTPSAAAEMAVPVAAELLTEMRVLAGRLARGLLGSVGARRLALERARTRLGDPRRLIDERRQWIDDLAERGRRALAGTIAHRHKELHNVRARLLCAHPQRRIADQRGALALEARHLFHSGGKVISDKRRQLEAMRGKLEALSPLKVLERGYSLTRSASGQLIRTCDSLHPGDAVIVTLRDGDLHTRIEEIKRR
jgi:exodeoxyribonuclease VII large subunit